MKKRLYRKIVGHARIDQLQILRMFKRVSSTELLRGAVEWIVIGAVEDQE